MMVSLNGESVETRGATTVAELAEFYGLPPQTILIEHNGAALHQRHWQEHILAEGDRLEFLRVVAGG